MVQHGPRAGGFQGGELVGSKGPVQSQADNHRDAIAACEKWSECAQGGGHVEGTGSVGNCDGRGANLRGQGQSIEGLRRVRCQCQPASTSGGYSTQGIHQVSTHAEEV